MVGRGFTTFEGRDARQDVLDADAGSNKSACPSSTKIRKSLHTIMTSMLHSF